MERICFAALTVAVVSLTALCPLPAVAQAVDAPQLVPVPDNQPVALGLPAPVVAAPCCTSQPVVPTYSPMVTYQPVVPVYQPVVVRRPVIGYRPVVAYSPVVPVYSPVVYARPAVVRTKVYYPGEPVRNFFKAVAP